MTQFPHDNFVKDYIPELLGEYGVATSGVELSAETKEIDVLFIPNQPVPIDILGLLAELVQKPCILEVYRNSVSIQQIRTCLIKVFEVQISQLKEAQKNKQTIPEADLTKLWILTPTLSDSILNSFGAVCERPGVYLLPESLKTGIVVIHQLPVTVETLWLRILGKGSTQRNAIRELELLPETHPYRENVLELIYKLLNVLEVNRRNGENIEREDIILMGRLDALYEEVLEKYKQKVAKEAREQGLEQGLEQGAKQGEINLTIRQLKRLLGELASGTEETIQNLDILKIEALAEALLDFKTPEDLTNWLDTHH